MNLVLPNDPILHCVCRPSFTLQPDTIEQMFILLAECKGMGLAAPQVGIDARLFVTSWSEVFVNPGILEVTGGCVSAQEVCLSLPGIARFKSRWQKIRLAGGGWYEGQKAVVIQHEINHLNGKLITDL